MWSSGFCREDSWRQWRYSRRALGDEVLTKKKAFNRKDRKENPQRTRSNSDNLVVFVLCLSLRPLRIFFAIFAVKSSS